MKTLQGYAVPVCSMFTAVVIGAMCCAKAASVPDPAKEDFSALERAVVQLLETGDASRFAEAVAPSIEDWRAAISTNRDNTASDPLGPDWQSSLEHQRRQLESGAQQVLAKASDLKVDFKKLHLSARAIAPQYIGSIRYSDLHAENESQPWVQKVDFVVTAKARSDSEGAERLEGEYTLSLMGLMKFPGGWRCSRGLAWASFPAQVADEATQREMAILAKASKYEGIRLAEDPALSQLAEMLKRFLQSRDIHVYEKDVLLSADALYAMIQKQTTAAGASAPPREEFESHWSEQKKDMVASAEAVLALMQKKQIDLEDAIVEVKDARFQSLYPRGGTGEIEGLEGNHLTVTFSVKPRQGSSSGTDLSGDYVLAAEEAMRLSGRWMISQNLRWHQLPKGVIDEKTEAELEFENHVAEHGTLPVGHMAPEIEFIRIDNEQKGKLSDFRGKVVILDFWATWCGPCQEPMAKMQEYHAKNPDWKDRVIVMPLSIDDTVETVRAHTEKRGWTNTFNVWAAGEWKSPPAQAYRVQGVPTCYVIDAEGRIAAAGHPSALQAPDVVSRLLAH